jgi:hypothetical protein
VEYGYAISEKVSQRSQQMMSVFDLYKPGRFSSRKKTLAIYGLLQLQILVLMFGVSLIANFL